MVARFHGLHRRDAIASPLLHDDEREDDHVDIERRRLNLETPLALPAEEALRHELLAEPRDLVPSVEARELRRGGWGVGIARSHGTELRSTHDMPDVLVRLPAVLLAVSCLELA